MENMKRAHSDIDPQYFTYVGLCLLIVFMAHFFGCFWSSVHLIQNDVDGLDLSDDRITFELYLATIYWAVTSMTTVGYGDITPIFRPCYNSTALVVMDDEAAIRSIEDTYECRAEDDARVYSMFIMLIGTPVHCSHYFLKMCIRSVRCNCVWLCGRIHSLREVLHLLSNRYLLSLYVSEVAQ